LPHGSLVLTMQSYDCLRTQTSVYTLFSHKNAYF
jgi:hypothetical protein